jgi:hypothetical protein
MSGANISNVPGKANSNSPGNAMGNAPGNAAGNAPANTKPGKFFPADLKRAFTEPTFFTALILGILMTAGGYIFLTARDGFTDFVTAQSLVFPFAAPFLAALPYAFMSKSERDINFAPLLRLRRGGKGYGIQRFFTAGIAGGAVILLSEGVLAVITLLGGDIVESGDMNKLFLTLALAFPFGFAFGVLAHALCFFSRTSIIAIITPEVFYLLLTYAFPYLDLEKYYPPLAVSPYIYGTPDVSYLCGFIGITIGVAVILTLIGELHKKAAY